MVEFKKMTEDEQKSLRRALEANALTGAPVKMDSLDTSFVLDERQVTEDLINAVQSVPCHY